MFRRKLYVAAATGFIATVAWGLLKMAVPKSSVKYVLVFGKEIIIMANLSDMCTRRIYT